MILTSSSTIIDTGVTEVRHQMNRLLEFVFHGYQANAAADEFQLNIYHHLIWSPLMPLSFMFTHQFGHQGGKYSEVSPHISYTILIACTSKHNSHDTSCLVYL